VRKRSRWLATAPVLVFITALAAVAAAPANLERALAAQRTLLEQEPQNAAVLVDFGNLLQLAGRSEEAEAAYRQALEIDPQLISAHFNLGLLLQERGEGLAALRQYRQALKLDPGHAWAHYQIGVLHEGWGVRDLAIRSYARAFALDPELRFPDVNAHVVDNKLMIEATLYAYRNLPPPQGPPAYEQPARIAGLLLERAPRPDAPPAESAAPTMVVRPQGSGAAGAAAPATPSTPSSRVLDAGDLRPGSNTGQVTGSGGRVGGVVGVPAPPPEPEVYEPGDEVLRIQRPEVDDQGRPLIVPFQPGQPSTGRLDLKLFELEERDSRG
jgi:hypothetical protein